MCPRVRLLAAEWVTPVTGIVQVFPSCAPDTRRMIRIILSFSRKWAGLSKKTRELESLWLGLFKDAGLNCMLQVSFSSGGIPLWSCLRCKVHPSLELIQKLRA